MYPTYFGISFSGEITFMNIIMWYTPLEDTPLCDTPDDEILSYVVLALFPSSSSINIVILYS